MGGKALGFEATRMKSDEYFKFSSELIFELDSKFKFKQIDLVPAYNTKLDFGDVDIVVCMEKSEWENFKESFSDYEYVANNGEVISVGYEIEPGRIAQVDFIFTGEDRSTHWLALDYYSYNDCGNLVGKLANLVGFSYGHKGLAYNIYHPTNETQLLEKIYFYNRYSTGSIHEMLGLDHRKFEEGFDTLEDIFKWIATSPLFHPDLYLFENVNAASRIRDRKRSTYNKFLDWCAVNETTNLNWYPYREQLRRYWFHKMLDEDNWFDDVVKNKLFESSANDLRKILYNGKMVSEMTGLKGKELGEFMKALNESALPKYSILMNPDIITGIINNMQR